MKDFDFAHSLIDWYSENKRDLPWRNTTDPYAIWVSEIMLQQTRVEAVKPYYTRFLTALPDIRSLAQAEEEQLYKLWQGLGYYSRVRNMQKAAKTCVEKYGGTLPADYGKLLSLCGIGEYTAGAVASFAFSLPYPALDGNGKRVLARFWGEETPIESPEVHKKMNAFLSDQMPKEAPGAFNQALIELGATLCGPDRSARCGGCPLLPRCRAFAEGKTETLPVRTPKTAKKTMERTVLIIRYNKDVALNKRPAKGLLAGLWEPVTLEGKKDRKEICAYLQEHGAEPEAITPLCHGRHLFTHLIWEMEGYLIDTETPGDFAYFSKEDRQKLAFPSAYTAYFEYLQ